MLIFPYTWKTLDLRVLEHILLFCSIILASTLLGRKCETSVATSYLKSSRISPGSYVVSNYIKQQKLKIHLSELTKKKNIQLTSVCTSEHFSITLPHT